MKGYEFSTGSDNNLIIVECYVNDYEVRFMIDTGASDTILDKNALVVFKGQLATHLPAIVLETASGKVTAEAATLKSVEALGKRHDTYTIHVYDFL